MQSAALSEIVERQLSGAELGNSKDRSRCSPVIGPFER